MAGKRGRPRREFRRSLSFDAGLSREIFAAYVNRADKMVIVCDSDYLVRMINAYGAQVLGIKELELKGARWVDRFVVERERRRFWTELKELGEKLTTGPLKNEVTIQTAAGERQFTWQHFGVRKTLGSPLAVLSVGEDVTKVKETEATLAKRNAILKALSQATEYFLNATPATWERNVLHVLEVLGKARGSERVYMCKNRLNKDGLTELFLKYEWKASGEARVFEGEEAVYLTYEAAGQELWQEQFLRQATVFENFSQDKPAGGRWNVAEKARGIIAIPIFVDQDWWGYLAFEDWHEAGVVLKEEIDALTAVAITFGAAIRRKRTEEALEAEKQSVERRVVERTGELKREKARLTASIHSMSMGFVLTDLKGEVTLFNHAVGEVLGKIEGPWTTAALQEKLGEKVSLTEKLNECMTQVKELKLFDLPILERFIQLTFTPIRMVEDDGRVIGAVLLMADVTEAKKLQLSRDEFFAVAAHELRTPLTAISGNASMIVDYFVKEMGNPEIAEMVDDIQKSAQRLIAIVNEYLDISRLELNKMQMDLDRFDITAEIRGVMEELREQARQKNLGWLADFTESEEVWVRADRERARQAVVNLLGNAIKYTEAGEIRVTIEVQGEKVGVRIRDTGKGVGEAEKSQLFQKFKRVGDRVYARDVVQGTGMGLYITRLLMEAMGGEVDLESSEPGKGSTFRLDFPKA